MTPYTHTTSDMHINVYQQEVRDSIGLSKAQPGALRSLRRYIARGLVKGGAWLLPEKPEVIGGTVFVLSKAPNEPADQRAA